MVVPRGWGGKDEGGISLGRQRQPDRKNKRKALSQQGDSSQWWWAARVKRQSGCCVFCEIMHLLTSDLNTPQHIYISKYRLVSDKYLLLCVPIFKKHLKGARVEFGGRALAQQAWGPGFHSQHPPQTLNPFVAKSYLNLFKCLLPIDQAGSECIH